MSITPHRINKYVESTCTGVTSDWRSWRTEIFKQEASSYLRGEVTVASSAIHSTPAHRPGPRDAGNMMPTNIMAGL